MTSKTFPLEPIEKASIDEMRSLQLKRLQQTLQLSLIHISEPTRH